MKRSFQGIHRPLLPVMLTIDAGQPQPSADPTPSQSVPTPSSSHVQITQTLSTPPPITQPPPTLTALCTTTILNHKLQPQPITPPNSTLYNQHNLHQSLPFLLTFNQLFHHLLKFHHLHIMRYKKVPSFEPSYHMSPPPSHEPEIQSNQIYARKNLKLMEEDQGDPFATPLKRARVSGDISRRTNKVPSTLEAAQLLTNVASEGFKGTQTATSCLILAELKVVSTPTAQVKQLRLILLHLILVRQKVVQRRKGKDPMDMKQIDLDALLARRLVEQEEEAAKEALATEFDYIQARLNADQIFAEKIQQEEREQYSIEERAHSLT
ncbi:hypothetical protein Tco_0432249 [Tanacetum coccineum]